MKNKDFLKKLKTEGINKISDLPSDYDYSLSKKNTHFETYKERCLQKHAERLQCF